MLKSARPLPLGEGEGDGDGALHDTAATLASGARVHDWSIVFQFLAMQPLQSFTVLGHAFFTAATHLGARPTEASDSVTVLE